MNYKMLEYDKIHFSEGIGVISKINQKNVCFVIIGIFWIRILAMDHIFVMDAII